MTSVPSLEDHRAAALLDAQGKAAALFDEIGRTLLRPGITESQLSHEIHDLAAARFGVESHSRLSTNPPAMRRRTFG
jgi:hypothetical protein